MDKRAEAEEGSLKSDPYDEISNLCVDIQNVETDFRRTIEICQALIGGWRGTRQARVMGEQELNQLKRQNQDLQSL